MTYGSIKVDTLITKSGLTPVTFPVSGLNIQTITAETGVFTSVVSAPVITGQTGLFQTLSGTSGNFETVTGLTFTGTTATFVSGTVLTYSATTISGNTTELNGSGAVVLAVVTPLPQGSKQTRLRSNSNTAIGFSTEITNGFNFVVSGYDRILFNTTGINLLGPATGTAKLYGSGNANYVGFRANGILTSNFVLNLPTGDGSSGCALLTNGASGLIWGTGKVTNDAITFREYTSNDTWSKPSGCVGIYVECIAGGGGGGGGSQYVSTLHYGGCGGGGGFISRRVLDATTIDTGVVITVGAGGSGGAGATGITSAGASGTNGGTSSFGTYVLAAPSVNGGRGGADTTRLGASGFPGPYTLYNGPGGDSVATLGTNALRCAFGPAGGGAGGSISGDNATITSAGSGGQGFAMTKNTGVTNLLSGGGGSSGVNTAGGGIGNIGGNGTTSGDGGGGGGPAPTATSGAGGNGGNGASPGGGGGGGGASINGYNGGNGGNGAAGVVRVWTW